jgi:hypothetical protein
MLHRRAVVNLVQKHVSSQPTVESIASHHSSHLDAVFPSSRDHLAAIKLQGCHPVVVLDGLEDASRAEVPNLMMMMSLF